MRQIKVIPESYENKQEAGYITEQVQVQCIKNVSKLQHIFQKCKSIFNLISHKTNWRKKNITKITIYLFIEWKNPLNRSFIVYPKYSTFCMQITDLPQTRLPQEIGHQHYHRSPGC